VVSRSLRAASFLLLAVPSAAAGQDGPAAGMPTPEAGEIAPPFVQLEWLQLDQPSDPARGGELPDVAALRGEVVVVTTYGHFCDACVRVGVPAANAIRRSNPGEVRVISITSLWQDESRERTLEKGRELGIEHAIALGDFTGGWTPYLDLSEGSSLTWAYVITRSGGILWSGDPSADLAEYYAAVAEARNQVPCAPLPASLPPELAPALAQYVRADFAGCEASLAGLAKKLARKASAEAARAGLAELGAALEATRVLLMDELERSVGDEDPRRFQRAYENVLRAFPKGACADRAGQLDMVMSLQRPHGPACRKWSQWFALEAARPANFPAERDKATSRFARELSKHLKSEDPLGADRAQAWLEEFSGAVERR
jgi:hypothetical protein